MHRWLSENFGEIPTDNFKQMKVVQKYFLALVPPTEILTKAHDIKILLREKFGIKYALKSPPHITLKMPFNYNEAKEPFLDQKLSDFLKDQKPFPVQIQGVGNFGNRVIFLGVEKSPELELLQTRLKTFCKKELNLIDELSDRNYHPHLTVAFKDVKFGQFSEVLDLVKRHSIQTEFHAEYLVILKRIDQKWTLNKEVRFNGK